MRHEKTKIDYSTGEVTRVNTNFIQFYNDKLPFVNSMIKEDATAVRLFLFLVEHMDKRNAIIISQQAISEALGLNRRTIIRCIKYLVEKKALTIFKSGTSNIYAINSQIVWRSNADGKEYALFDARVYISKSEQDPIFSSEVVSIVRKKGTK